MNIVICGSGRSGTTLISRMLNKHPDILSTNELTTFTKNRTRINRLQNPNDTIYKFVKLSKKIDNEKMAKEVVDKFDHNDIIRTFQKYTEPKFKHYCDKSPAYSNDMEMVMKNAGLDAKVICCLRDPRDVLCSQIKYYGKEKTPWKYIPYWVKPNLEEAIKSRYWLNYMIDFDKFYTNHPSIDIFFLNFSDLVTDTPNVLKKLGQFLNVKDLEKYTKDEIILDVGLNQWKKMIPDVQLDEETTNLMKKYGLEI
jgi:hypothetical protein